MTYMTDTYQSPAGYPTKRGLAKLSTLKFRETKVLRNKLEEFYLNKRIMFAAEAERKCLASKKLGSSQNLFWNKKNSASFIIEELTLFRPWRKIWSKGVAEAAEIILGKQWRCQITFWSEDSFNSKSLKYTQFSFAFHQAGNEKSYPSPCLSHIDFLLFSKKFWQAMFFPFLFKFRKHKLI